MSTHDLIIDNQAMPAARSDINSSLQALGSQQAGTADPAATYAYERQARTDLGVVRRRNAGNSAWLIDGTLAETFLVARSTNTILAQADHQRAFIATSTFTQTLTAAATLGDGWYCWYRNDGVGVITLDPNASELINGSTTLALAAGQSCAIFCNGSSFKTVGLSALSASGSITSSGYTQSTARLLGRTTGSTGAIEEISIGSGLTMSAGALTATPPSSGALTFITSATASASAMLDFEVGSTYDEYIFELANLVMSASCNLLLRISIAAAFKSDANYYYAGQHIGHSTGVASSIGGATTSIPILNSLQNAGLNCGTVKVFAPSNSAAYKQISFLCPSLGNGAPDFSILDVGSGSYNSISAWDGVRFIPSSGNITSGTIRMYGVSKT